MKSNHLAGTPRARNKDPRRRVTLTNSVFYFALCISVIVTGRGYATVITSGDVQPGPPGVQSDPWNVGLVNVGALGVGSVTIENGGRVNGSSAILGYTSGAVGTLLISGPGSTWDNSGTFWIGDYGTGNVTITSGGTISTGANMYVGIHAPGNTVTIEGASGGSDATLAVGGKLYLGGNSSGAGGGTANVTVGEGGRLDVTGGIWIAHGSTLDPPWTTSPQMVLSSQAAVCPAVPLRA
jgi:T5SS/PEP-CTERM-associated repeat protein